jgi:ribonucleoside-diphosphate reductase alpha chain
VITINRYPIPQIEKMAKANRKIGLGVMGFADMLMQMDVSYASEDAATVATEVMEFIDYISKSESVNLAKERGKFANFEDSVYNSENYFYHKYANTPIGKVSDAMWKSLDDKMKKYGIRNATTTCIAPTGTISMIAGASGGIEPLFGLVFIRNIMDGTKLVEINPVFETYLKSKGLYSNELVYKVAQTGSVKDFDAISKEAREVFMTAHDISPYWHVKIQAAFQSHTDNAVSKTVNFKEDATVEDIKQTYVLAYKNKLKGLTVYRNNSRTFQPMNIKNETTITKIEQKQNVAKNLCPECGAELHKTEGCTSCPKCGYSVCS